MALMERLSKNIKSARKAAKLSVRELSIQAGMSEMMVRYYEMARCEPTVSKLLAISRATDRSVSELLKGCI